MQEILLAGGKTGRYFPDSGPGTKLLFAGDKNYGFFGEVSEDEMGLNQQFNNLLSNTYASTKSVDAVKNTWFKFILNNRVLFFPKIPLAAKIPLKDLYAMRAAADADSTTKPAKDPTTGQPLYTQNLYLTQGDDTYKVRLFDMVPGNDMVANNTQFTISNDAEVVKLLFAMITGTNVPDTLKIKNRTPNEFSYINGVAAGQCYAGDLTVGDATSNYQETYYTLNTTPYSYTVAAATEWGWRPVLEHIPATERSALLLMPDGLEIINEGMPTQVTVSGTVIAELFALTGFTNVADTTAVTPSGASGNLVLQLQSLSGYTSPENVLVTGISSTSDDVLGLYDTGAQSTSDYNGYVTGSTDDSSTLTYTGAAGSADMSGYAVAA